MMHLIPKEQILPEMEIYAADQLKTIGATLNKVVWTAEGIEVYLNEVEDETQDNTGEV